MKSVIAVGLFALAVALMFVERAGAASYQASTWSNPAALRRLAAVLADDGYWIDAQDVLQCAADHAGPTESEATEAQLSQARDVIRRADSRPDRPLAELSDGEFWMRVAHSSTASTLPDRLAVEIAVRSRDATDSLLAEHLATYALSDGPVDRSKVAILLGLSHLGAFTGDFEEALLQEMVVGEHLQDLEPEVQLNAALGPFVSPEEAETPEELWKAVWSVWRSSKRAGRAASILGRVQETDDLRHAVVACGSTPDAAARLNAVLAVLEAGTESSELAGECLRQIGENPAASAGRLDALYHAAGTGPEALEAVLRQIAAGNMPMLARPSPVGPLDRALRPLARQMGSVPFAGLKLLVVVVLTLPLTGQMSRWFRFSTTGGKHVMRWGTVLVVVLTAVAVHAAAPTGASAVAVAAQASVSGTQVSATGAGVSGGWFYAVPLTLLAILAQLACVAKARDRWDRMQADPQNARVDMHYLRFYTEAPVFVGFLGSVSGAVLLQVLAAGQMIYFAYVSTASGLLAFLWIQYRYAIRAEADLEQRDLQG